MIDPHVTNDLHDARLSFIGCGAMAEAMIGGLLKQSLVAPANICGSHPRLARREELQARHRIHTSESNADVARFGHAAAESIVVLCVKPQRLAGVLIELKDAVEESQLVISIVAGARSETIAAELNHAGIVRAMPNTPAQVGAGITAWTASESVTERQRAQTRVMLRALGAEIEVETENMVDMATALSGTGPTYVFTLMEALTDAGVHMGFSRRVAEELVQQTILGSVLFARESGKHPAELRNMVTSPGGTSAEAIYQMEKGGLRTVLSKAVWAAYQRAVALGQK